MVVHRFDDIVALSRGGTGAVGSETRREWPATAGKSRRVRDGIGAIIMLLISGRRVCGICGLASKKSSW